MMRVRWSVGAALFAAIAAFSSAAAGQTPASVPAGAAGAGDAGAASPAEKTITLAADEWCPYNCRPDAAAPGYMVEIVRRALARRGVSVNYVVMPWPRALADADAGRIDGVFGASRSEFKKGVFPRVSQGVNDLVLVMNADAPFVYSGMPSLRTLRIAAARNYSYDQGPIDAYFATEEAKKKVDFTTGDEVQSQNLRKLLARGVDAWIETRAVAQMTLADISPLPPVKLIALGGAENLFIAFSPARAESTQWADLVAAETINLRKSGELSLILARYNLRDWE